MVCICDAHIEQKPKNVLIIFDTFQAYFVMPPRLVGIAMYCHGYVLPWLCIAMVMYCHGSVTCLLLLFQTPVATVNPGLSCEPTIIIEHFIINKPLMLG